MQDTQTHRGLTPMRADLICLLVAIIWGTGFIASQYAIDANMSSALILAGRFSIASLILLPLCWSRLKHVGKSDLVRGGAAGLILFCAFYTQIAGQARTTVSHSAFLTATNVVLIPFFVWIFARRRPSVKTFVLAASTLLGVGILTHEPGEALRLGLGDGLVLVCAVFFALHIFYLGQAVEGRDPMVMTLIQMATAALVSIVVLLVFERDAIPLADYAAGTGAILYIGLFSTCICYLLQTLAQKYTTQSRAGILLSTEGLFGSLFSVLLHIEPLTPSLLLGGLIILASVILLELPIGEKK